MQSNRSLRSLRRLRPRPQASAAASSAMEPPAARCLAVRCCRPSRQRRRRCAAAWSEEGRRVPWVPPRPLRLRPHHSDARPAPTCRDRNAPLTSRRTNMEPLMHINDVQAYRRSRTVRATTMTRWLAREFILTMWIAGSRRTLRRLQHCINRRIWRCLKSNQRAFESPFT